MVHLGSTRNHTAPFFILPAPPACHQRHPPRNAPNPVLSGNGYTDSRPLRVVAPIPPAPINIIPAIDLPDTIISPFARDTERPRRRHMTEAQRNDDGGQGHTRIMDEPGLHDYGIAETRRFPPSVFVDTVIAAPRVPFCVPLQGAPPSPFIGPV